LQGCFYWTTHLLYFLNSFTISWTAHTSLLVKPSTLMCWDPSMPKR